MIKKFYPEIENREKTRQRWLRIKVSLAAYAYEFLDKSIITDQEFDKYSLEINPSITTRDYWHDEDQIKRYYILDKFFLEEFDPSTGMWIRNHPELSLIEFKYKRLYE